MTKNPGIIFDDVFDFLKVERKNFKEIKIINQRAKVDLKNTLSNIIFRFLVLYLKTNKVKSISQKIKKYFRYKKVLVF